MNIDDSINIHRNYFRYNSDKDNVHEMEEQMLAFDEMTDPNIDHFDYDNNPSGGSYFPEFTTGSITQSETEEDDISSSRRLNTAASSAHYSLLSISHGDGDDVIDGSGGGRRRIHHHISRSKLNGVNVLNFFAFGGNLTIACIFGLWGLDGYVHRSKEVWEDHQTLITPAKWTFALWYPVYLTELFFTLSQLVPTFRARQIIQEGASYFFVNVCLGQIAWILFFSFRMFLISFIAITVTLGSLVSLLLSQHLASSPEQSRREYWLFRFPFVLHLGWIFVVAGINLAIFAMEAGAREGLELPLCIIVMAIWLLVAFFFVGASPSPEFVIPSIMIWTFVGIGYNLRHNPSDELKLQFSRDIISAFSTTSFAFAILVAVFSVPRVLIKIWQEKFTIHVLQLE